MKVYRCDKCGNMMEVIQDGAIVPTCCGTSMKIVVPNNNDLASKEKHVPVIERNGTVVMVYVGKEEHPSIEEHYIEWIEIETNTSIQRKYLEAYGKPQAKFFIDSDDEIINAYAYCNIHGLWSKY